MAFSTSLTPVFSSTASSSELPSWQDFAITRKNGRGISAKVSVKAPATDSPPITSSPRAASAMPPASDSSLSVSEKTTAVFASKPTDRLQPSKRTLGLTQSSMTRESATHPRLIRTSLSAILSDELGDENADSSASAQNAGRSFPRPPTPIATRSVHFFHASSSRLSHTVTKSTDSVSAWASPDDQSTRQRASSAEDQAMQSTSTTQSRLKLRRITRAALPTASSGTSSLAITKHARPPTRMGLSGAGAGQMQEIDISKGCEDDMDLVEKLNRLDLSKRRVKQHDSTCTTLLALVAE